MPFNAISIKDGRARLSVAGTPTKYSFLTIFSSVFLPSFAFMPSLVLKKSTI